MSASVGVDLVCTEQVRASIDAHGRRYLERVFTADELLDTGGDPQRLAARFAAKEAAMKALDCGDEAIPWRSIGVRRTDTGRPQIALTGPAAELARRRGVTRMSVSLTHEGSLAAAVVLAEG